MAVLGALLGEHALALAALQLQTVPSPAWWWSCVVASSLLGLVVGMSTGVLGLIAQRMGVTLVLIAAVYLGLHDVVGAPPRWAQVAAILISAVSPTAGLSILAGALLAATFADSTTEAIGIVTLTMGIVLCFGRRSRRPVVAAMPSSGDEPSDPGTLCP